MIGRMKTCQKCRESKPLTEFYAHKRTKDGVCTTCKECRKKWAKEYARAKRMTEVENRSGLIDY